MIEKPLLRTILCAAAFALSPCAKAADVSPFYSFSFAGKGVYYASNSASTFLRPSSYLGDYWAFCQPYNCYGNGDPSIQPLWSYGAGVRFDDPGSVWAEETNVSSNARVDLAVHSFPPVNLNTDIGKYVYDFSTSVTQLAGVPAGETYGLVVEDGIQQYAFPDTPGSRTYTVTSSFDGGSVPIGYSAQTQTDISVSFYASWFDSQGNPVFFSQEVYHNTLLGTSDLSFSLSDNLNDYPVGPGVSYGTYSITLMNEMTFTASPVPIPASGPMFGLGLVALFATGTRFRALTRQT